MKKTEIIPKIKVEPKSDSDIPGESKPLDETVRISDDELGTQSRIDDTKTGFKLEALDEQYSILDKVGDGGMGIVYLAQDKKLGRYVAIKRLNRTSLSNPVLKERFFREAKAIATLNHIHIVHIYALGEDSEGPYIVMEYVPGPPETSPNKTPHTPFTLANRVSLSGPFIIDDALTLLLKLCRAIEYAHNCGVIHRDLKPSNVLLDESGEPKLADFGLARRMGEENEDHLTVPGEKMLSVGYGAPEQEMDASQTDQRADIYGLGAILYFSITGKNPRYFRESEVPESIRMPLVKALETDRNKRWNTVKEFTTALSLVKAPSTIEIPTIKTTWRCKWCDTVNPVTISYCGKCGWDGGETCAECGADTRVGIQFCGSCGADAREYEMAQILLKRMRRHWDEKAFELVIHEAGRSVRFQPTGPNGRKLLNQIDTMGREAYQTLARRKEIKQAIDKEVSLHNYDLVRKYIEEYNTLSTDNAFAELAKELPSLTLNSNLKKIQKAIEQKEWDYAERACRNVIASNPANSTEAEFLIKIVGSQRTRIRMLKAIAAVFLILVFYVLSAAPVYRYFNQPPVPELKSIYRFADFLHKVTFLQKPLEKYAILWNASNMYDRLQEKDAISSVLTASSTASTAKGGDMASLQAEFEISLKKIEETDTARIKTWQRNYATELTSLQLTMQKKGDFEGWSAVRDELLRLEDHSTIPDEAIVSKPQELVALQNKFRDSEFKNLAEKKKDIRSFTQHYIDKLENLQKKMTMQGKMEDAAAINTVIKKVKSSLDAELPEPQPPAQPQPKNIKATN
ncbi:MAG: serine/threonine-protein kinase [Kiritimatiellae bacterium]|nr:serine/threonine-protein kinase [Kiritimatiellia bacterium]MDD5521471.1 serine/threonine-protein kinase [Kiritimatiellia bacterium]